MLGGQGAILAVTGAFVLAEQLRRADSIDEAVAAYERMWRPIVTTSQRGERLLVPWFVPHDRLHQAVRRAALNTAALPGIDRLVAAVAAGRPSKLIAQLSATRPSPGP